MIDIMNLCKTFGSVTAVDHVTLQVHQGDIFGLVGPDGAGKTTLIRLVCGLLAPDSGSVKLFNDKSQGSATAESFGYMPQKFSLYGDLTVMENINFFGSMYGLDRKTTRQRADEILQITDLIRFKERFADNLSGGMKQKLALTCALISRPKLLVLDEPTFGVDPESRKEFWKILYQLNKEGMTILVSTPYMDEAELCKRVGFMERGKLVAVDSPGSLKNRFPYQVLEVKAASKNPDIFYGLMDQGLIDAGFYGDKYHLVVGEMPGEEEVIIQYLADLGMEVFSIKAVPATMEDVFLSLAEKEVG